MASLREYFVKEHDGDTFQTDPILYSGDDRKPVVERIVVMANAGVTYLTYFIPAGAYHPELIEFLLKRAPTAQAARFSNMSVEASHPGAPHEAPVDLTAFPLAYRIHFYIDEVVTPEEQRVIEGLAAAHGFTVVVRDHAYGLWQDDRQKPWAFISHDSRDKADFVADLAHKLSSMTCPVWYDEYSLKVGDSLRESIDRGIREARKCIVVLSPNYISNTGWGAAEFNGVFGRHVASGGGVILPVWHNVTRQQVADYSHMIADVAAVSTDLGVDEVARRLFVQLQERP